MVVADPVPPDLARTLDLGGYAWKATTPDEPDLEGGWAGVIVDLSTASDDAGSFLRGLRRRDEVLIPTMVLIGGGQLAELEHRDPRAVRRR
jgi:hypothetical protein